MFKTIQLTLASLLLALAGCGGGSSSDADTAASGTGLAGIWRTDISDIFADNPSIFGGIRANCTGPAVLVLQANGRFSYDLDGTCTFDGHTGIAQSNIVGNYRVSGSQIIISGSSGSGRITVGILDEAFLMITDGAAAYTLSGNHLALHPASGPGTVQNFTRSSS
jgi:hypothetical protein